MKHSPKDSKTSSAQSAKKSLPRTKPPQKRTYDHVTSYQVLMKSGSMDSLSSVYSAHGGKGDYKITGKIKLELWYMNEQLFVHVVKAKGLAATKKGGSNPYVKMHLLPECEKMYKRKTSIHKRTTKPDFNETLKVNKTTVCSSRCVCVVC